MCLAALEQEEAHELLQELEASASLGDARDQVRMADKRLSLGFRFGFINQLAEARRVAALVQQIADPIVRCSFRSMFAWALVLASYYDEALAQACLLCEDATEYRVDLALSYGHSTAGAALAGLHRFDEAVDRLQHGAAEAKRTHDENGEQNSYSIRMRVLVQAGQVAEACASEPPDLSRALKSMRGEVLSSRSLALATIGRLSEATELATEALAETNGIEANQLAAVTLAVCAIKARDPEQRTLSDDLIAKAFQSGAVDPVVSGYRGNLDLLSSLLAGATTRERTVFLLRRAGDEHLAAEVGPSSMELVDPIANLSIREREIHGLICQGLSNRQIAKLLFISEATVKVHVQHVFDKTGIRSRTALALNAARRDLGRAELGTSE
jgi:DNA-binding CsgD family transcriptional regulator